MTDHQLQLLNAWAENDQGAGHSVWMSAYDGDDVQTRAAMLPTLSAAIIELRTLHLAMRRTAIVAFAHAIPAKAAFAVVLSNDEADTVIQDRIFMATAAGGAGFLPADYPWARELCGKAWDVAWDEATMEILTRKGGDECQA